MIPRDGCGIWPACYRAPFESLFHLPLSITKERGYVGLEAPSACASDKNCSNVALDVLSPIVSHITAALTACLAVIG